MSEIKVSEMIEAESVNDEDLIMIIQNGINKKVVASKVGTGQAGGETLPIGSILQYPDNTIPENWLLCDGSAISRTNYVELFDKIGTLYGSGDGSTTFNLPDLRGKVLVGKNENDTDFNVLGKTGGEKKHTLTIDEMPSHYHRNPLGKMDDGNFSGGNNQMVAGDSNEATGYNSAGTDIRGGDQAHNNLQPYIVQNYIIKAKQVPGTATKSEVLPIGSEIEFEGNSGDIPIGWEQVDDPHEYSTSEKVVGKWIDGKTIYRKVITLNLTQTNTAVVQDVANLNIKTVTHIEGISQSDPTSTNYSWDSTLDRFRIYYNPITKKIHAQGGSSYPTVPCTVYVIIEYTKTTD